MPAIAMCEDKRCPSRTICLRFTATPSVFQTFQIFDRKKDALRCKYFIDNATIGKKGK